MRNVRGPERRYNQDQMCHCCALCAPKLPQEGAISGDPRVFHLDLFTVPQQVGSSPRVPGKKSQNRKVCGEVPRCLQVLWKDNRRGRWGRQGSMIFQGCLRPGGMAEPGRGGLGTGGEEVRGGKSPVPHLSPQCCRPMTRGPRGGDCWARELLAPWAPVWRGPHTRLVSSWAPVLAWGVGSQGHSRAEDRGYCPVTLPAPDIPGTRVAAVAVGHCFGPPRGTGQQGDAGHAGKKGDSARRRNGEDIGTRLRGN